MDTGRIFVAFTASAIPFYPVLLSDIGIFGIASDLLFLFCWVRATLLVLSCFGFCLVIGIGIGIGIVSLVATGFCVFVLSPLERKRDWIWVYLLLIFMFGDLPVVCLSDVCFIVVLCTWSLDYLIIFVCVVSSMHER